MKTHEMHKKTAILLALTLTISLVLGGCVLSQASDSPYISGVTMAQQDTPENGITVGGTVESVTSRNVYTTHGFIVNRVDVDVGDFVTEGQILAVLDTGDMELIITQQRLEIEMLRQRVEHGNLLNNAELAALRQRAEFITLLHGAEIDALRQSTQISMQDSLRLYNTASVNLENNTNLQILSAEAALVTAELNLTEAQRNYDTARNDHGAGNDAHILAAETTLRDAGIALETSRTARDNARLLYEAGGISRNELRQAEDAFTIAENQYNDAQTSLENASTFQGRTLEQLESALQAAITYHQQAEILLAAARIAAEQELEILRGNVATAGIAADTRPREIAADMESREIASTVETMSLAVTLESREVASTIEIMEIAIQILERQLEEATIKAPISGTVTAVIAKEGAVGMGLLFVIEDTENLRITTRFRGYDIARIETGMEVTITSDATGNTVYNGTISRINPAATMTSPVVEFEAVVAVTSQNTGLRIGTNTRLNLIFDGEG
jgi:multidrug resistance efflux pump